MTADDVYNQQMIEEDNKLTSPENAQKHGDAEKFNTAIKIWPESEIVAVIIRLNELEKQLRTTGMPAEILLRDFSLKLAVRAAKLSVKRRK